MDLVKKNWISILFGVIAICAVVADFWPMGGKYEALRTKADARRAVNTELQSLATKQRNEPHVGTEVEPKQLAVFPTQKVIDAGKAATDKLAEGAKQLQAEIVKLNVHQPLVPGALPGQADNKTPLINFGFAYFDALNVTTPAARAKSIAGTIYHADIAPT